MRIFSITAIFGIWAGLVHANCDPNRVRIQGDWGQADFSVEVVDTIETRARGLMFRESMARFEGMLFVFSDEQERAFWMKNTLIPLDILYFDRNGRLVSIARNAIPGDLTSLPSNGPTQYALEINGGLAKRLGVGSQTVLVHPSVKNLHLDGNCLN